MFLYTNRNHCAWLLLPLLFTAQTLCAGDVLERRISAHFEQELLKTALTEIARQGGFEWSYNARILDPNRRVTLHADGWTVRETLTVLLGDNYTFKPSGEYLILKKNKKPQQHLSGYLTDPRTGKKIPNATIYDRQTLRSTTTDGNGFYQLPVSPRSEVVISKLDYQDTVLFVTSQTPRFVKLELLPDSVLPGQSSLSLRKQIARNSYALERFFVKTSQRMADLNVQDSLHRRFQISFLPGIGTNHRLSGHVVNDWSVNILAGYSRGNRMAELAGIGNLTRENMTGLQAAGVFNNLRGNATGAQMAGVYNFVGDTMRGFQAAGVVNMAGYGQGVQAAGVLNLVPNGRFAVQAAGVANVADTVTAAQVAGVWNGANVLYGAQVSGVSSHAQRVENGVQVAGVTNSVGSGAMQVQIAGVGNVADTLVGTQVAGLFNYAKRLHGVQIGVVNIARENKGLQLGLLNLSKAGGYLALEGSANDILPANLTFKSGRPGFHIALTAGLKPDSTADRSLWAYGAGVGACARFNRWSGLTFDLLLRHLNEGDHDDRWQEWAQFSLALDLRLAGGLHLGFGPSLNMFASDPEVPQSKALHTRVVRRNVLFEKNYDGWLSGWVGWTAAVRWVF
ncbi:MAG: hypothetical protein IPM98_00060 [Lewinellaceae bacterium]|nr:hypothetical protein [Lewinellaceae bacterium]